MRFGSVCSGIEAASVAWHPLGWRAAWLAEIEPFPSAVLAHHYPDVPNLGDMTTLPARILSGDVDAPDVLCGGTPCQTFSVAGLRKSLDDSRGNLSMIFCEIANAIDNVRLAAGKKPCIIVWENVPGILSARDNAFGCFLGALVGESSKLQPPRRKWANVGCVFGPQRAVAWRVLDAQYFGMAQRRNRLFVVASARAGFDPTKILFEFEGERRDSAPVRKGLEDSSGRTARSTHGGDLGEDFNVICMASGQGRAEIAQNQSPTLTCLHEAPIVFYPTQEPIFSTDGTTHALTCGSSNGQASVAVAHDYVVRRLMPVEYERLMGFPDGYTAIPWRNKPAGQCPDGPRDKAVGNSWAAPVVRWIGARIETEINEETPWTTQHENSPAPSTKPFRVAKSSHFRSPARIERTGP